MLSLTLTASLAVCWLPQLVKGSRPQNLHSRQDASSGVDWDSIEPSSDLKWQECDGDLLCARLQVPLDWSLHNSTDGLDDDEMVVIAMTKVPAGVSHDDPTFGGSILYNPGGPGISGTDYARYFGNRLLTGINNDDKHFEVIGFDPRGVGATTPPMGCHRSYASLIYEGMVLDRLPPMTAGETALRYWLESYKGFWDLCISASQHSNVFAHASSSSVARDMLAIVDQLETSRNHCSNSTSGPGMLQYYGTSYGTFLGATFASMFPDRVGLMVLDGVMPPDSARDGDRLEGGVDLEKTVDSTIERCLNELDECPLVREGYTTVSAIKARFDERRTHLETTPYGTLAGGGISVTGAGPLLFRDLVGLAYQPVDVWYARGSLEGIATDLYDEHEVDYSFAWDPSYWAEMPVYEGQVPYSPSDAFPVISCLDSYDVHRDVEWAQSVLDAHLEQSPTLGQNAASEMLRCYGLPKEFEPTYRFRGRYGAPAPDTSNNKTTVAPVLIVNNRLDLPTPLAAAYGLSRRFEGSAVVVQEQVGHLVSTSWGDCVFDILRAYFHHGHMPENGTSCDPGEYDYPVPPPGWDEEDPADDDSSSLRARGSRQKAQAARLFARHPDLLY